MFGFRRRASEDPLREFAQSTIAELDRLHRQRVLAKLDEVIGLIKALNVKGTVMAKTLDELKTQVDQCTAVEASAKLLIDGIAQRIADAGGDPVKIQAISDELAASSADLAASVAANTPAAPVTPPPATASSSAADASSTNSAAGA